MYLQYFGFKAPPFGLTPNTQHFFGLRSHVEAVNICINAIQMGEGLVKVIGEVGTGKTLVCRMLLNQLKTHFTLVFLPNPSHSVTSLYYMIATELGVAKKQSNEQLLFSIQRAAIKAMRNQKPVVVLCDEAQALSDDVLEAVRLLGNLETEQRKLIQLILFAQPELEQRLSQYKMRQLLQRITFSANLTTLTYAETVAYIDYRLEQQAVNADLFTFWAKRYIWLASGGIARVIGQLCHKSLLFAFAHKLDQVSTKMVKLAIKDTAQAKPTNIVKLIWG